MDQQPVIAAWISRAGRRNVQWPIFVYDERDRRLPAVLSELSYDGCQVRLEHPLGVGEDVILVHPELGEITAEVRWWTAGRSGMRFADMSARNAEAIGPETRSAATR